MWSYTSLNFFELLAQASAMTYNVDSVSVENVDISYSQGSGLVAVNCYHSMFIKNSRFHQNCEVLQVATQEAKSYLAMTLLMQKILR